MRELGRVAPLQGLLPQIHSPESSYFGDFRG